MNNWIVVNEFLSHHKPHIVGMITPLLMVMMSYVEAIADWLRLGGMFVGIIVGVLTTYKLLVEIRVAKKKLDGQE